MRAGAQFLKGFATGIPIGLGYFAVSFSLGIVARNAGLSPVQGLVASFLNLASAGEYALFTAVRSAATLFEIALVTFVVNARYLLMSCALSQKFSPETGLFHRLAVAFAVTDELFAIAMSRRDYTPHFSYGAMAAAVPLWSVGTYLGVLAGNRLPAAAVSALSVSLYGMFIAIIVPPAKKSKTIAAAVAASFALSFLCAVLPVAKTLSSGTRTIILTVLISSVAAAVRPVNGAERAP